MGPKERRAIVNGVISLLGLDGTITNIFQQVVNIFLQNNVIRLSETKRTVAFLAVKENESTLAWNLSLTPRCCFWTNQLAVR